MAANPIRPRSTSMQVAAITAAAVITGAALFGCSSDDRAEGSGDAPTETTVSQPSDPASGDTSDKDVQIELRRIGVDLTNPIAAVPGPTDNSMIVAERGGTIRLLTFEGADAALSDPMIDISDEVGTDAERGLLGVALSPDASRLFVSYTSAGDGTSHLDAYRVEGSESAGNNKSAGDTPTTTDEGPATGKARFEVDQDSRLNLLSVTQPFPNHNGGHIAIGPDGMLYMGLGDGGGAGDPYGNAQDRSTLLGKILRLNPEASGPEDLVAEGNPEFGPPRSETEIWLTGVRNPWRFSFDPETGDLWIGDVGQNKWEEINLLTKDSGLGKGANLGWDLFEGTERFDDADPAPGAASDGPFVEPIFTYGHGPGCSITGGVVYRGEKIPALRGTYIFSDYCDGTIRGLRTEDPTDGSPREGSPTESSPTESSPDARSGVTAMDLGVESSQVVSFATDADGETYVLSLDQGMFQIVGTDTVER